MGGLCRLLASIAASIGQTLYYAIHARVDRREVLDQAYDMANRSVFLILWTSVALGLSLVYQAGLQLDRLIGDFSLLGPVYLQMILREFGPTVTALMLTTRIGTGMAAEIAHWQVTEQNDALMLCGIHPAQYHALPRLYASVLATFCCVSMACVVLWVTGFVTAHVAFGVSADLYMRLGDVDWQDLVVACCKTFSFGMAIPMVSFGVARLAYGGTWGVGVSTTQAVVACFMAILGLDLIWSAVGFGAAL